MEVSDVNRWVGKKKKTETSKDNLVKKNPNDAGLDVRSNVEVWIPPHSSELIPTDLFIHVPEEHVGLLWSRSGLSVTHQLEVGAGCIDSSYRGEVKVHLYNHSDIAYHILKGDRIAQLLTIPINPWSYVEVNDLEESERNENGFGSSGNN